MYGYPVDDVAEILDCAVGTVKSRCARGRARLLPLLRPDAAADRETGNRLETTRVTPGRNNVPAPAAAPAEGGEPHR
jgi:RNA polymerase sigma-70 factor (ECF subfamily)